MIVALVNQARGAGRTTLAVHLAGELALQGKRVALLDTDLCSGALEWAERRRRNELPALFETIGIASPDLRCGVWNLHARFDHVIIDTPAASTAALRAALLAAVSGDTWNCPPGDTKAAPRLPRWAHRLDPPRAGKLPVGSSLWTTGTT